MSLLFVLCTAIASWNSDVAFVMLERSLIQEPSP